METPSQTQLKKSKNSQEGKMGRESEIKVTAEAREEEIDTLIL